MRFFILVWALVIYSLPGWSLHRVDTIMGLLSLEQKVEMLFVAPQTGQPKDRIKVGDSLYVNYEVFDTRPGIVDSLELPYPSEHTLLALRNKKLKHQLFNEKLQQYINNGYDGIIVPDTMKGVARIYIGDNDVVNHTFIKVIDFPCNLLSDLISNVSVNINPESLSMNSLSFFDQTELPALNLWQNKSEYGISFNDMLKCGVLFWDNRSYGCKQQVINAFKYGWLDETLLNKCIAWLLNYQAETDSLNNKTKIKADRLQNRYNAFKGSVSIYQKQALLPLKRLDTLTASVIDYRINTAKDFFNDASYYHPNIVLNDSKAEIQFILCDSDSILRSRFQNSRDISNSNKHQNVLVYAGQLSRKTIAHLDYFDAVVQMPEAMKLSWSLLAQAIYGGYSVDGISVAKEEWNKKKFYSTHSYKTRLGLTYNFIDVFNTDSINKIDSIVNNAIKNKAMPGAQLLVVKSGNIVLQKSYGYHTYNEKQKVKNTDLYDVASITKLAVTFPLVMQLYEKKVINLDATLRDYITGIDTTDKADITIRELLLHQSGLVSFIPFYNKALDRESLNKRSLYSRHHSSLYNIRVDTRLYQNKNAKFRKDVFSEKQTGFFKRQVSESMFMNESYIDSMYNYIYSSRLRTSKNYLYSDLGYYLLQKIIEQEENKSLDSLFYKQFADLLGAGTLRYKPLDRFDAERIAPTEDDLSFRCTLLDGYVHDQGAAMLGGVAAHAGLFANAGDLAKLGQMLLNEGQYGGIRFIKPNTIGEFTKTINHGNRRGLGVDKPELDPGENRHVSPIASQSSYGHTGFTGTILWLDPEHDLIYIFLSNRIYPHAYNKKLIEMNIRTKIHDVVYNTLVEN